MRTLSFALILFVFVVFLVNPTHASGQSRLDWGVKGGYAGGSQDLTNIFSSSGPFGNVLAGNVSGTPRGWTVGLDGTYWFDNGFGIRSGLDFDDLLFGNSASHNDLLVEPAAFSAVYGGYKHGRSRRVYGGGGIGWYFAQFAEQSTSSPGGNGLCIYNCYDTAPTTHQHGSHIGFQGLAGLNLYHKEESRATIFVETEYSYAKVSSWSGDGIASGSHAPVNVGSLTITAGFRF
jgi:hypothetical protein